MYQDGETLFCKNNVCVHPPALLRQQCDVTTHHPGYMSVVCKINDKINGLPTLHLTWIPNTTLKKYPSTLENSIAIKKLETTKENDQDDDSGKNKIDGCQEAKEPIDCKDCERVCSGGNSLPSLPISNQSDKNGIKNDCSNNDEKIVEENDNVGGTSVSYKENRSTSLTSMCSLSITFGNDGKKGFFFFYTNFYFYNSDLIIKNNHSRKQKKYQLGCVLRNLWHCSTI